MASIRQKIARAPYNQGGSRSNLTLRNHENSGIVPVLKDAYNIMGSLPESHTYNNRQSSSQHHTHQLPMSAISHVNAAARQLANNGPEATSLKKSSIVALVSKNISAATTPQNQMQQQLESLKLH